MSTLQNSAKPFQTLVDQATQSAALLTRLPSQTSNANPLMQSHFERQSAPPQSPQATNVAQNTTNNTSDTPSRHRNFSNYNAETQALKEKVKDIQMSLVMHLADAVGGQDGKRNKYKIEGLGNIELTGQKWFCWNLDHGGVGPIDFLMWAKKISFSQSVRLLAQEFGESVNSDDIKAAKTDGIVIKKTFIPPNRVDKNIEFVKHYLHYNRAIPTEIIDELILDGKIYADEHRNCVFYANGIAELRSTFDGDNAIKQLVPGSVRNDCFFVPADLTQQQEGNESVAICESSIDAMSYRAFNPSISAVSSAGAGRDFPRKFADTLISNGVKVIAAFDADEAGDRASQSLFNHFFLKNWITTQYQNKFSKSIDEELLFSLLDKGTIDATLGFRPDEKKYNIFFFNDENPFSDPSNPPTILLNIKRNPLDLPMCDNFPITVTPQSFDFIVNHVGLTRQRPTLAKDWNEQLKQLRSKLAHSVEPMKSKP